ncbi:cysteine hydrolase family protein [Lutibaculum baratangense]|uniref:Isochorismatase n=1 Tax=Lutibaculum baratangense AMV1 TaxID=631454 RepID=V4RHD6_9HYPH|nr:cysteine hydrolase family protein [Lutibaculum baratangense]ESR24769.1 Isochorismatase [Lutibaculum baratangense AMV1]
MTTPKTLLELAGATPAPAALSESAVVVIDAQREYEEGPIALPAVHAAIAEISALVARARRQGRPVLHVVHRGKAGGLFDPEAGGRIIEALKPHDGERVIEKTLPNAFAGTELHEAVKALGVQKLVVCGFMTHMCVSSTVRAALDLGLSSTVVANATATRDLPSQVGGENIGWEALQLASLAALADRFATVVAAEGEVPN